MFSVSSSSSNEICHSQWRFDAYCEFTYFLSLLFVILVFVFLLIHYFCLAENILNRLVFVFCVWEKLSFIRQNKLYSFFFFFKQRIRLNEFSQCEFAAKFFSSSPSSSSELNSAKLISINQCHNLDTFSDEFRQVLIVFLSFSRSYSSN